MTVSSGFGGASTELSVDITDVDETVTTTSELGEYSETATVGSDDVPMPIFYKDLVLITDLVAEVLWSQSEWSDHEIEKKKANLEIALQEYPMYVGAKLNSGKFQILTTF